MRLWCDEVRGFGANLLNEGLIVNGDSSQIVDAEYDNFISSLK